MATYTKSSRPALLSRRDALGYFAGSPEDAMTLFLSILFALVHLHGHLKIAHGNLTSGDIRRREDNKRLVLSLINSEESEVVAQQSLSKSDAHRHYRAPESIDRVVGPKSDMWAFGVILLFVWRHIPLPEVPETWLHDMSTIKWISWLEKKPNEVADESQKTVLGRLLQRSEKKRISAQELLRHAVMLFPNEVEEFSTTYLASLDDVRKGECKLAARAGNGARSAEIPRRWPAGKRGGKIIKLCQNKGC